jgi:phosphonate transport system substrate-binding protein
MSHIVPFSMLLDEGISLSDLSQYDFLSDQHNVALGVLMGDFDAGAVNLSIFESYKSRGLKELARTPEVSEHLFVARSTLSKNTINALRKALYAIKDTENAQSILSPIKQGMTALAPADDGDYDNLRDLLRKLKERKLMQ